ncbi:MAG: hypothetical protein AAFN10_11405 [Bacteroidota bacterium]
MAMIILIGRYLSNLNAIKDSVPDSLLPLCCCVEEKDLLRRMSGVFKQYAGLGVAILDVSSCPEGVNRALQNFQNHCPKRVLKIVIHPYQGRLLNSLQARFADMQFVHLEDVTDQLAPLLTKIRSNTEVSF